MLPVLPFLIGGALGTVAGVALKKYYDDNDIEIHEKLENSLMSIEEWLDEKLVALDKYKDSLNLNDDNDEISSSNKEEFCIKKLQDMKQKVYHDSFVDFINFYKKLDNTDLGKLHLNSVRSMFIGSDEVLLIISMNVIDDKTGHEIEQDIKELKNKIQKTFNQHKLDIYIDVFEF